MVDTDDHPAIPEPISAASVPDFDYGELDKEDTIGSGGEANVYEANLNVGDATYKLAVKEPRVDGTVQTKVFEEFEQEAETWANLDEHRNIVSVYGYGSESVPWIGLEYMDGGTLGDRSDDIDFEEGLWLAGRIAEGVRYGHRHGIAHLDLKPNNILLRETPDGEWAYPKVGDWGLAKLLLEHSKSIEALSPRYAAPEQFNAEEYGRPDDITDIYQFGAIVYELLTGKPPFTGSATDVMQSILQQKPEPPSNINPQLPTEIDNVLLKSLSKNKTDRFESILLLRRKFDQLFYDYATAEDVDIELSGTTVSDHSATNTDLNEEISEPDEGSEASSDSTPLVSRRGAIATLGVVGGGGILATQGDQIAEIVTGAGGSSEPGDDGDPESTTLSSSDLNEVWTTSASYIWDLFTDEELFFIPQNTRDGEQKLVGRKFDTGDVRFESDSLEEGYDLFGTGATFSANEIYLGTQSTTSEDINNAKLYALDRNDGSILFDFETPTDGKHTRIREVSKIDDGPVIFGSDTGGSGSNQEPLIYAVDPEDGTEQWRAAPEPREGFVTGIITADDKVYSVVRNLRVYDGFTGELQQEVDLGGFFGLSYIDDTIITTGNPIEAFDTEIGEVVWETPSPGGKIRTPLTPADSVLYGVTGTGIAFKLDASSGDISWTSRIRGKTSDESPVLLGPTVWVSADNGEVSVFMKETGEKAFTIAPPPDNNNNSRAISAIEEVLYLGGSEPTTYTLDTL